MDLKIALLFLLGAVYVTGKECVDSFCFCKKFEVHCEMPADANTGDLTYQEFAAAQCAERGGRLANLADEEVDTALRTFIQNKGLGGSPCIQNFGFFFGLNDIDVEGTHVWSNGNPLCPGSYTNWAPHEPNNNTKRDPEGQDCSQLWYRFGYDGLWDDEYCNARPKGYICEISSNCCCSKAP